MRVRVLAALVGLACLAPLAASADDAGAPLTATTAVQHFSATDAQHAIQLITSRVKALNTERHDGEIALDANGVPLFKQRAYVPFMPASTMKIITATVALRILGPTWKPVTTVAFDTQSGTITLIGGGDPQLTSAQLGVLADSATAVVLTSGALPTRLLIDDTLFAAPTLQQGVTAQQQPSEERPIRALVVDQMRTKDTGLDAGKIFHTMLLERGIDVPFKGRGVASGDRIASVEGYRLQSSLKEMLWYSDNDIAEMLFRLSAIGAGQDGSWSAARHTAYAALTELGVPTKDIVLVDGAGLSRANRLTVNTIASTLHAALENSRTQILQTLLPAAGREGTLRTRYRTAPAKCANGIVRAKTGSLRDVISLAGYAPAQDGSVRSFSLIVNGLRDSATARNKARATLDGLAAAISGC